MFMNEADLDDVEEIRVTSKFGEDNLMMIRSIFHRINLMFVLTNQSGHLRLLPSKEMT